MKAPPINPAPPHHHCHLSRARAGGGLQALSLAGCGLRAAHTPHLCGLLRKTSRAPGGGLRVLDVSNNQLGPAGVRAIAEVLRAGAAAAMAAARDPRRDKSLEPPESACTTLASLGLESVGLGFLSRSRDEPPDPRATHEAVCELCGALAVIPALTYAAHVTLHCVTLHYAAIPYST